MSDKSNSGQFKIGETTKPIYERINKYKTSNPNVNLEFCTHIFKYGAAIESQILRDLYDHRVAALDKTPTEWLKCDIEIIVDLIIKYMNNPKLLGLVEKDEGCKWLMKTGPKKGLKCSEKIHSSGFCAKHAKNLTESTVMTDNIIDNEQKVLTIPEIDYNLKSRQQSSDTEREEKEKSIPKMSEVIVEGCEWLLKSGPRKGGKCSEKIHSLNMCSKHAKMSQEASFSSDEEDKPIPKITEVVVDGCEWLLKSGPRKGGKCSEKIHSLNMCSKHVKMSQEASFSSDEEDKPITKITKVVVEGCEWLMKSGPRKGGKCSEKIHSLNMCSKHAKMLQEASSKND